MPEPPTLLHITHYKAGSQWVYALLRKLARGRIVEPRADGSQLLAEPVRAGAIYPTLYLRREQLEAVELPPRTLRFIVIRDLRDTLVSAYFSIRNSHGPYEVAEMRELRERLRELDRRAGIELVLREWLPLNADIQRSWLDSGEPVLRFEDLIADGGAGFARALAERYGVRSSPVRRRLVLRGLRFERLSGGRRPGEADSSHHYRAGVPGDWRNHLDDQLSAELSERWGDLLAAAGYSDDLASPR